MAATTLPASFQRNHITPSVATSYDEFGAHSIPAAGQNFTSWDEEVVPALRKRLEDESKRLDHRIGQLDSNSAKGLQQNQGRQQPRPVRRLDRAHEVLQDGLGSDDLIPSGWATGSSAQFTAIAPRAKAQTDDRMRSISSNQPYTSHDYYPQQSGSPPTAFIRDTPSPSSAINAQNINQAREKARRLAREREMLGYGQNISPAIQQNHPHQSERMGEADAAEMRHDKKEMNSERVRTVSSPALQKFDEISTKVNQPLLKTLPRNSSKTNLREESVSKIPIPASRSIPGSQDQNFVQQQDVRKTKSVSRLSTKQASPSQGSKSKAGVDTIGRPLRTLQYNATSNQQVLDEFGPLGGTPPKRGRGPDLVDEAEAKRTVQRSVSNPWDEEMIPTVKKRLEQQKMMEDLSHDEDLVDTWDRNGLPLSKTQVSLRQRASEGRNGGGGSAGPSPKNADGLSGKSVDEGSERMKRLQEQLNLGSLGQQSSISSTDDRQEEKTRDQRRLAELHEIQRREQMEMQDMQRQQQQNTLQQQQQQQQYQATAGYAYDNNIHQTNSTTLSKEERPVLAEVDAAGCCKCTVM